MQFVSIDGTDYTHEIRRTARKHFRAITFYHIYKNYIPHVSKLAKFILLYYMLTMQTL